MKLFIPLDETDLVAVVYDPDVIRRAWVTDANCLTLDTFLFFPDEGQVPPTFALACCAECPVALKCLATALIHERDDGIRFGWWGGLGPEERQALWERLGQPAESDPIPEPEDPAARAVRLRAHRHTIPTIAAELGCSERTVYRLLAANAA